MWGPEPQQDRAVAVDHLRNGGGFTGVDVEHLKKANVIVGHERVDIGGCDLGGVLDRATV
jgi:hypothetical protein